MTDVEIAYLAGCLGQGFAPSLDPRLKRQREADAMVCRCGHRHDQHAPSSSINYTAGRCLVSMVRDASSHSSKKCGCRGFVIARPAE